MEGNPIDALLSADPRHLAQIFVTAPERYDFIDDRLFDLWARVATVGLIPPDLEEPEFGADRFNTARDRLVRAGKSDDDALQLLLSAAIRLAIGCRLDCSFGRRSGTRHNH